MLQLARARTPAAICYQALATVLSSSVLSQDAAAAAWVAGPASALLKAAAGDARLLRFRASDVAAAALALGRDAAGAAPAWPLPLASLTGHAVCRLAYAEV